MLLHCAGRQPYGQEMTTDGLERICDHFIPHLMAILDLDKADDADRDILEVGVNADVVLLMLNRLSDVILDGR